MISFAIKKTSHGNYLCPFCYGRRWKTLNMAERHLYQTHRIDNIDTLELKLREQKLQAWYDKQMVELRI